MALSDERTRASALKRLAQRAVRTFGLHIGRYPPVDSLAYHLKTVLRELGINCVLDVGAHNGEFCGFLRDLDFQGQIISFEPVKSSFEILSRARAADPKWRGENIALGAENGELEMNIYAGSVFNSFLKPDENIPERFRADTQIVRVDKVPVRRLEPVIDELLQSQPDTRLFLKMDTQGYDLQVLRGAGRRIEALLGLQSELAARSTYAGMPTLAESLSELDRFGFELTGIFPVAREMDHLRVIELDCVMCRKQNTQPPSSASETGSR